MANINVTDLIDLVGHSINGVDLLDDSESFMLDLSDNDSDLYVYGGCNKIPWWATITSVQ